MGDVSLPTVALSALVSIMTGYIGSLLTTAWQRRQDRRTHGLALLAEIRTIQRALVDYEHRLAAILGDRVVSEEERLHILQVLPFWRHDTAVFASTSGRVGLFSPGLAVSILEFYSRVRWLDQRAGNAPPGETAAQGAHLRHWLEDHRSAILSAGRQSRALARGLRRETPPTARQILKIGRGARLVYVRQLARLGRSSRSTA